MSCMLLLSLIFLQGPWGRQLIYWKQQIAIVDDGNLMLKDDYTMSIFKLIEDVVLEFEEHLDCMLEQQQTPTIIKH